jgi:hypothetical protein
MTIETKELVISKELKRKVEMVFRFANVKYAIINGNIKSIKNTNITMIKEQTLKNILFLKNNISKIKPI